MIAQYTVKIGNVFYKAGEEIPDVKEVAAVSTSNEVEPPVSDSKPTEQEKPIKRQYTRRK